MKENEEVSKYSSYLITDDKIVLEQYKKILKSVGLSMISRIRILIREDIEKIKTLKNNDML